VSLYYVGTEGFELCRRTTGPFSKRYFGLIFSLNLSAGWRLT